ncbi:hypothetical protein VTK73DRAFT_1247 [Phialemonium thermophilum]|uniref:HMG box domain-containing protein n=1 Tax=Phialemonium thermophilum TaxID=223376 RepID=A0ABR3Y4D7_9PEZI
MLSKVGTVAGRQLGVHGLVALRGAGSLLRARVALKRPTVVALSRYRSFQPSRRSFTETKVSAATDKLSPKKKSAKKSTTKKPAANKASTKKRAKKTLSDEEKQTLVRRELKRTALKEPKKLPDQPWLVYTSQKNKGAGSRDAVIDNMRNLGSAYRALSRDELERLQETARQNKEANNAAYKEWVENHTPEQIAAANRARNRLRRKFKIPLRTIKDDRQPRKPVGAFALFAQSRWQSGEFANQPISTTTKLLGSQWKALSDAERRPFLEAAEADRARYQKEFNESLSRN